MPMRRWQAILVLLLCSACKSGTDSESQPRYTVDDFVSSVEVDGQEATYRQGNAPESSGGPQPTVTSNQTVINGGTSQAVVRSSSSSFIVIYVFIGGLSESVGGYYELRFPVSRTSATVLLSLPQSVPVNAFDVVYAIATSGGQVSSYVGAHSVVTNVGTGDVQVTLSWDANSDIDLHVVDPTGEEIYWGHDRAASGGVLDLDSNAGCDLDNIRNENITWPSGRAPRGTYTVRVDYWSKCSTTTTNYSVRVNQSGASTRYTGSFTGTGDSGGRGSGRLITTFTR